MANPKLHQVICIDKETSGLDCTRNPITQLALRSFRADTLEDISRFSTFVRPYAMAEFEKDGVTTSVCPRSYFNELPEGKKRGAKSHELLKANGWTETKSGLLHDWGALDYTNTTHEKINEGIDSRDLVSRLCDEFTKANTGNGYTTKPILLGHNVVFDISFLQWLFVFHKKDLSKYLDGKTDGYGNFQPTYIDTLNMARQRWYHEPMANYKLGTCCEKAGVELVDAHEAMADVNATVELFHYFTHSLRNGSAGTGETQVVKTRHSFSF
jgi:DNA polymerase III alpha subunit (gram-positive type)